MTILFKIANRMKNPLVEIGVRSGSALAKEIETKGAEAVMAAVKKHISAHKLMKDLKNVDFGNGDQFTKELGNDLIAIVQKDQYGGMKSAFRRFRFWVAYNWSKMFNKLKVSGIGKTFDEINKANVKAFIEMLQKHHFLPKNTQDYNFYFVKASSQDYTQRLAHSMELDQSNQFCLFMSHKTQKDNFRIAPVAISAKSFHSDLELEPNKAVDLIKLE